MRLSKELMHAGILGYQRSAPSEWEMSATRAAPTSVGFDPVSQVLYRRKCSLKVSPRGWKAIVNALRD